MKKKKQKWHYHPLHFIKAYLVSTETSLCMKLCLFTATKVEVNLLSTSRKNLQTGKRLSSEWTNKGANEGSNKTYYTTDYRHVDNKSFESGFQHASCEKVSKDETLKMLRNLSSTYSTSLQGL